MNRTFALIAATAIMLATPALAGGPYKLDAKGGCHDSGGKFAAKAMCAKPDQDGPYKRDAKGNCHTRNGKFAAKAKCAPPG
jgi:hypothetical protein